MPVIGNQDILFTRGPRTATTPAPARRPRCCQAECDYVCTRTASTDSGLSLSCTVWACPRCGSLMAKEIRQHIGKGIAV
jgi:hypothetical protein